MPLLEEKVERSEHEFMFHYCGVYLNAVRWHPPGSKFTPVDTNIIYLFWTLTRSVLSCLSINCEWIHVCFHPGDSVFKVHFFTPNFSPPGAGGCYDTKICLCFGKQVTQHNPPLLYDLFHDPSESHPLTADTEPRYAEIMEQIGKAVERHRDTLTNKQAPDKSRSHSDTEVNGVPCQMTWEKILWRPWLQPCCGTFPFCGCKENKTLT